MIKNIFSFFKKQDSKPSPVEPRMYLILREDLAYKYIQGGHALAQFALSHPEQFQEWRNKYLICLSVFNGLALREVQKMIYTDLRKRYPKVEFSVFNEPDLETELNTAIAIFENGDGYVSEALSNLKLATK